MSTDDEKCDHPDFITTVEVTEYREYQPVDPNEERHRIATVRIRCASCGIRFRFAAENIGGGLHPRRAKVGVLGDDLRIPIVPAYDLGLEH